MNVRISAFRFDVPTMSTAIVRLLPWLLGALVLLPLAPVILTMHVAKWLHETFFESAPALNADNDSLS